MSELVPYTGARKSLFAEALKSKEQRQQLRDESQTDGLHLERRRLEVGYILNKVLKNLAEMSMLSGLLKRAESKEDKTEIQQELQQLNISSLILAQAGNLQAQTLLVDCVTMACQDGILKCETCKTDTLIDEDNPQPVPCPLCHRDRIKRTRHSRVSIGEILFNEFIEDDPDAPRINAKHLDDLSQLFYLGFKGINAKAFAGKYIDELGVEEECDDLIAYFRLKRAMEEAANRAAAVPMREGVYDDERQDIERRVEEGNFGNTDKPAAAPAPA